MAEDSNGAKEGDGGLLPGENGHYLERKERGQRIRVVMGEDRLGARGKRRQCGHITHSLKMWPENSDHTCES